MKRERNDSHGCPRRLWECSIFTGNNKEENRPTQGWSTGRSHMHMPEYNNRFEDATVGTAESGKEKEGGKEKEKRYKKKAILTIAEESYVIPRKKYSPCRFHSVHQKRDGKTQGIRGRAGSVLGGQAYNVVWD